MRELTTFSRIFETNGKFETGIKFFSVLASMFSFYSNGRTCELLNDLRTCEVSIDDKITSSLTRYASMGV